MKNETKESISRISLIVFCIIFPITLTFSRSIWAFFGFLPVLTFILGVEKHRKIACVALIVFLSITVQYQIVTEKLIHNQTFLYIDRLKEIKQIDNLENKPNAYEHPSDDR